MRHCLAGSRITLCVLALFAFLNASICAIAQNDTKGEQDRGRVKVSLKMEKADIQDILRELFKAAKANYVLDEAIKGKLSVSFDQVPFRAALESVLKLAPNPLTYTVNNGIYSFQSKVKEDYSGMVLDPLKNKGGRVEKIPGTSLNSSATEIVRRFKKTPEIFFADSVIPFIDFYFLAFPADNSILVRFPDTPEGEQMFGAFRRLIQLVDILPREVDLRVEMVLMQQGKGDKSRKAIWEMKGRTVSEGKVQLQTNIQGHAFANFPIILNAEECNIILKPTVNGDESIQLEAEAHLSLNYRLAGDSKLRSLHNTFTGTGRYISGATMPLASITLKSQSNPSTANDTELLIFITPILSKRVPPLPDPSTPQE